MSLVSKRQAEEAAEKTLERLLFNAYAAGLRPVPVKGEDATYVYMRRFTDIGEFHIRVSDNLVRVFTFKTMPMKLKEVLAMIHAIRWPCQRDEDRQNPMSRPDYVPEHFLDTGWMTGAHEYVVCLPNSFLNELTGKSLV
jgi:hypothetical protein